MARKLAALPAITRKGDVNYAIYDKYLDGDVWALDHGIDYNESSSTFMQRIRIYARKQGVKVTFRNVTKDGLILQRISD